MDIGSFDLNLLKVFDALYAERNVTRAGLRIGLSQSAVSGALSRDRPCRLGAVVKSTFAPDEVSVCG